MDEINVLLIMRRNLKCVVLKIKDLISTTIIDNKENILLIDFRTNE